MSDTDLPTRHRADDDLEALNSGSFASVRTPNGTADLLDPASATATEFSIDGDADDDDDDDDDDSDGGEPIDKHEFKLAEKTSQIMEDYRAYLAEVGGAADPPEDDILDGSAMEGGEENIDDDVSYETPSMKPRDPVASMAGVSSYRDNLDDVNFDNMHAELGRSDNARRSYKYPAFRSKRFKQYLLILVAACVVIGSIVGISSAVSKSKKEKDLPDWEAELEKSLNEEQEKKTSNEAAAAAAAAADNQGSITPQMSEGLQTPPDVPEDMEVIMPPPTNVVVQSFWFDWDGGIQDKPFQICDDNADKLIASDIGGKLKLCTVNAVNATHVHCCVKDENLGEGIGDNSVAATQAASEDDVRSFWFEWDGGDDGPQICSDHANNIGEQLDLCLANATHVRCCVRDENSVTGIDENPTQGVITQPTTAKVDETTIPNLTSQQKSIVYQMTSITYKPAFADRTNGYEGQTYLEAIEFCAALDHVICPYKAICPLGPDNSPLGGYKQDGPNGSWLPIIDYSNGWVQVGPENACTIYDVYPTTGDDAKEEDGTPTWGVTGEGNEEITRHIMCCLDEEIDPSTIPYDYETGQFIAPEELPGPPETSSSSSTTTTTTPPPQVSADDASKAYQWAAETFKPQDYDRGSGWLGQTYAEAIQFCALRDSNVPCPYEALCPLGINGIPAGGFKGDEGEDAWVPIIDSANGWVQIAANNPCIQYIAMHSQPPMWGLTGEGNEAITRNIMCCQEPVLEQAEGDESAPTEFVAPPSSERTEGEQAVLDTMKPVMLGRDDGFNGYSHEEAEAFCQNIGGYVLCPIEAYCPNGPTTERRPLFLEAPAFPNEQWAPFHSDKGDNEWVLIGTVDGNPASTCLTHEEIFGTAPVWGMDGTHTDLKENVMCCADQEKQKEANIEEEIRSEFKPVWADDFEWEGTTHNDGMLLCNGLGGRALCPYTVYCPHGPGQQTYGKHVSDFNTEGEQWAPFFDAEGGGNHWVMVGQKHGNSATTCMTHEQLEGSPPVWGETGEWPEMKKHIMCCEIPEV